MNARRQRIVGFVVVAVLPALLAFTVVRLLRDDGGGAQRAAPSHTGGPAVPPSPAVSDGDVDLAVRFAGSAPGVEPTFMINEKQAAAGPPPEIRDCRRFADWAQRVGGIPVDFTPSHVLSVHARRSLDLNGAWIEAVPVAQVSITEGDGPWVELACRDGAPTPTATPSGEFPSQGEDDSPPVDRPHVLVAGQTIELPMELSEPYDGGDAFPHGVSDYELTVSLEIDGIYRTYRLKNGDSYFRCCGRTTYMGYQAASYEWNLSPPRSLRHCEELRYAEEPPPPTCTVSQR
ncbi:hypothetical protein [Micromonospora cathayae]|uniref:PASTA domain-containing protein n=1 Tax=Micromonospora cathayae TaxID=3028804 RepID=A0ABY7ZN92_9ACTN|nr:hypothetical protein [Micromonospora sp. HUAS 3]WDZ83543.1 hypothetical protein PVK37_24215 [Micromonospora sp. HUAS 3]